VRRSRDPRSGFTLIETLVALVVIAAVALVAQRGVVAARLGLDRARATLAAEAVARSIVETELARLAPAPGVRQGETDGLAWTVTAEPIDLPLPPAPPPRAAARPGANQQGSQQSATRRGEGDETGSGGAQGAGEGPAAQWRPLRVTVEVANGRGRPLKVETLHLVRER
jgi:prepilin-type N-terminal cleavage/methylation domain-containing protein